jgi:hypothetical protein
MLPSSSSKACTTRRGSLFKDGRWELGAHLPVREAGGYPGGDARGWLAYGMRPARSRV